LSGCNSLCPRNHRLKSPPSKPPPHTPCSADLCESLPATSSTYLSLTPRIREDRLGLALEVLPHPLEVTPGAIDQEARSGERVVLPGIDNELRRDPERAQGLIHLLAAGYRHVEVPVTAQEQRRSADPVGVKERVGHLEPRRRIAPRRSELGVVFHAVFVGAVGRELVAAAGAADRRLEARVTRDQVVGEQTAVAPAADPQACRIGEPQA